MDLRYWYDRERWNRICDRWLILVLALLYPFVLGLYVDSVAAIFVYGVLAPLAVVTLVGIALMVLYHVVKDLVGWLQGY